MLSYTNTIFRKALGIFKKLAISVPQNILLMPFQSTALFPLILDVPVFHNLSL